MHTASKEMSHSPVPNLLFPQLIEGFNKLLWFIMTVKVKYYFYLFSCVLNTALGSIILSWREALEAFDNL